MKRLSILTILAVMIVAFQNCGPQNTKSRSSSQITNQETDTQNIAMAEVDRLKNPKPELVCGDEGYGYLMDEYLTQHCAICHESGGFAQPAMAEPDDISLSATSARLLTKENFLNSVRDNRFCGPDCNLSPEGEVYQAIEEWLDNKTCN